jgi:hypothetical protein
MWDFIKAMFEEAGRAANTPTIFMSPADQAAIAIPVIFFIIVAVALAFVYSWVRDFFFYRKWTRWFNK